MSTAIEFNHVGKQSRLNLVSIGMLSHYLNRWWHTAFSRKKDPYLCVDETNDRTTAKSHSDYVWTLRDIDFKGEQGDGIGTISKNGADKSTLLKLLYKVTEPTVESSIAIISQHTALGLENQLESSSRSNTDNNRKLISVIIPSYNRIGTISETIDSILRQKVNANIEIVIGDDCSTDGVRELLLNYQRENPEIIRLIFHKENIGLGANWATCVKACKGEYICNCDNDDYWHNPHKLQIQLDYMESHPTSNVLITGYRTHNRDTGEITEHKAFIDRTLPLQQAIFQGKERFCNATIMYRTSFLKQHLPLEDYITHRFTLQDWNTWIILSAYTDFDIIDDSTATLGIETASITRPKSVKTLKKRLDDEQDCYKYCCSLFPEDLHFDEEDWNAYVYYLLISQSFRSNDFLSARYYAKLLPHPLSRTIKARCAKTRFSFYFYNLLKHIKK